LLLLDDIFDKLDDMRIIKLMSLISLMATSGRSSSPMPAVAQPGDTKRSGSEGEDF
jgi:hypothetical protein